jgi:UDP-N-acetylmuramyl pentapeptide phosphotransferase/UDP-N-acetylglucosamine-1-phosphate transferase
MSSITISLISFAFVFAGALLGISLRDALPKHHLTADSKEAVKVGTGLVATMTALVLGLLVASAKASYDTQSSELTEMSSKVVLLDRVLAHYGPEAKEARDQLRTSVVSAFDRMWSKDSTNPSQLETWSTGSEVLYDKIQSLSLKDDTHRSIQAQALSIAIGLGEMRWLMYEQRVNSVSVPFLIVLIFWLTIIFMSFGLFAPSNATVVASLLVSALSVSGAILLILEMYTPYAGLIQISSAPLRAALAHLGE